MARCGIHRLTSCIEPTTTRMFQWRLSRGSLFALLRVLVFVTVALSIFALWNQPPAPKRIVVLPGSRTRHPIDTLIKNATATFETLLSKRTKTLAESAAAYRARRGRHPPPDFDVWHKFASQHNVILVEDFFDQIYNDLGPFWGVPAKQIRQQARQLPNRVIVRDRKVQTRKGDRKRLDQWIDMATKIQHMLPDLDLPLSMLDEPRVAVPSENVSSYMATESELRKLHAAHDVVQRFATLYIDKEALEIDEPTFFEDGPYWDQIRGGCAPDSPSRDLSIPTNLSGPPMFCSGSDCAGNRSMTFTYKGFVSNWTRAKDPCLQPELLSSHGALIAPSSQSTSHTLIPIFGSSKLSMVRNINHFCSNSPHLLIPLQNNDILLPSFAYWQSTSDYSTGNSHGPPWNKKTSSVIWRGISTGGRNTPENWTRFHRHRFVALLNASAISSPTPPPTSHLPPYLSHLSTSSKAPELAHWLSAISDVAFTKIQCDGNKKGIECTHTAPYYTPQKKIPMHKQFAAKYLPDIDGNGFSGRYLAFLRSTSLPIKATLFSEWHDSRLVPWYHFVPMQNSFVDV